MKKIAFYLYLLGIHVLLFAFFWRSTLPARWGLAEAPESEHIRTMKTVIDWRSKTAPDGAVIFIGDSITERLATVSVASNSVNMGISGIRTDQLITVIPKAINRSSIVFLQIGANDFTQGKSAGIISRMKQLSDVIPGKLIWTGVMLDEAEYVNSAIAQICKKRRNCTYIQPVKGGGIL